LIRRLIWVLAATALAAIATAQQDFDHRPSPFAGRTYLTLSLFEEVRTELKTTSDENTKIDELLGKLNAERQDAFGGGDFDAIREAIDKINTKYDEEVQKVLTGDQTIRLKQLFIQFNGSTALANGSIQKDLALTDDQKAKVKAAQDDQAKKMKDLFSAGQPDDFQASMKKIQDEVKAALDKVLTDDQRAKFKTMEGAKFEFKKFPPPGGTV
jgi:hypothetical protein